MTPLSILKKLVKLVRGGAAPWQIFLGVFLGVLIGMTPGFNMTVLVGLLVFLVLNVSLGLLLLGLVVGKVLCLLLAPVTFEIGYAIIHGLGLEGLFGVLSETPVVALMDLHVYCLVGGLPVALVLGGAMGWALARAVVLARRAVLAAGERSEKARRAMESRWTKLVLRLVFGKQKKTMEEMLAARPPAIRKAGLILCVILIAAVVVLEAFFVDDYARAGLKAGLEAAVGAEVDVADMDVSLFGPRVKITGLQVTDPDKPTHNMMQVDRLEGSVSAAALLSKRVVIDELKIGRLKTDAPREKPGYVLEKRPEPQAPADEFAVSEYFEGGRKVLDYLRKAKEYLDEREKSRQAQEQQQGPAQGAPEAPSAAPREDLKKQAAAEGYLKLSALDVLARRPAVTIRKLEIEEIPVDQAETLSVTGQDVCDKPELNENPMTLNVRSNRGLEADIRFDYTSPQSMHAFRLVAPNVSVGDRIKLSKNTPVDVSNAIVDVVAEGRFNHQAVAIPVVLKVRDMKAASREGQGTLGLDPATTSRMFQKVSSLTVALSLEGPVEAPRVRVDAGKTLASLREELAAAGQKELANQANQQLEKLGVQVPASLPGGLDALKPGGLFGTGGDKKPDEKRDEKKEPETKPAGLLDGLFKK